MKTYEAMFLLDAGNPDFEAATEPIRQVLARIDADVLSLKPWDERRLAYDIKGRKRGLYVLTYFKADPARVNDIQREVQLNELILRAMLVSADHLPEEQIHAETPATLARVRRAAADAERAARRRAAAAEQAAGREGAEPPAEGEKPDRAEAAAPDETHTETTEPPSGPKGQAPLGDRAATDRTET